MWLAVKLLLALATIVILGSESRGTHDHSLQHHDTGESCNSIHVEMSGLQMFKLVFLPLEAQADTTHHVRKCCNQYGGSFLANGNTAS
jgi:hypothetical protein